MEQNTDKLIEDQFKTLPVPLQRAITLMPWRDSVAEVAKSNSLTPEQSQSLEMETMFVLYGFEDPNDFIENITRELTIEPGRAKLLADNVRTRVFAPVLAKADELDTKESEPTLQTATEAAPSTPEKNTQVVVAPQDNKPSINLVEPPAIQKPINLTPAKPTSIVEKKLSEVVATPKERSAYPDGVDPYREPV